MHTHIAIYKWKSSAASAEIENALAAIAQLAEEIPGVIEISCAKNTSKYNEGYTHVIVVRANSQAAIDAYRNHPSHTEAAAQIEAIEQHGIGVDFADSNLIK